MLVQPSLRDFIAYIVLKHDCVSPFRISRMLVLLKWLLEDEGLKPVSFSVEDFEKGFYIPEIANIIKEGHCFKRDEARKWVIYVCSPPVIPDNYKLHVDNVMHVYSNLSDGELNHVVVANSEYRVLLARGGFRN